MLLTLMKVLLIVLLFICCACQVTRSQNDSKVFRGEIKLDADKRLGIDDVWFEETNAKQSDAKQGDSIEVNLFNCAGYLASGKMVFDSSIRWNLELNSDTIAPDAKDKVKLCPTYKSPEEEFYSGAFAVAGKKIDNFSLKDPDLKKVFLSLPSDVQKWANCSDSVVPDNCVRKEKNILSLDIDDDWADTDGDGHIDLILIHGNCSNTGDYTCSRVMKYIGFFRWVEIAYSTPA